MEEDSIVADMKKKRQEEQIYTYNQLVFTERAEEERRREGRGERETSRRGEVSISREMRAARACKSQNMRNSNTGAQIALAIRSRARTRAGVGWRKGREDTVGFGEPRTANIARKRESVSTRHGGTFYRFIHYPLSDLTRRPSIR